MSFDLTNKNIQDTFQNLLQKTGSDNRLYDLTGNEVGDLRIAGSLTAQQYIVSSSVTNISIATLSGSTSFGNSSDDTHTFTGHITASGNISASGTITAEGLTITDDFDLTDDLTVNGDIRLGTNNSSRILFKDASGNYTQNSGSILKASGDSLRFRNYGNFIFNQFNPSGQFTVNGTTDNDIRFRILHTASNPRVQIPTGSLQLRGGGGTGGHITASGNFSGSSTSTINVGGNITTNDSFLGQKLILGTVDNTDNAYISASDGNIKISGDGGSTGDVSLTIQNSDTSTATTQTTTLQFQHTNQNAGKIVGGKDNVYLFGTPQNDSNMQFHTTLNGTDTERMRITSTGLIGIGTDNPGKRLEVIGDISASGDMFARSGSFNYITASDMDLDGETLRIGGESFTKANIQALKLGRTLKPLKIGRVKPDIEADDGSFLGNITASGNISASGDLIVGGSTTFGDSTAVTHQFTGSINASGSLVLGDSGDRFFIDPQGAGGQVHIGTSTNDLLLFKANGNNALSINTGAKALFYQDVDIRGNTHIGSDGAGNLNVSGHITASGNISTSGDIINTQVVQMTNSSSVINTFNTSSHQSCKYILQVTSGSHIQSSEMLVIQNSSNAFNTEYAQINSGLNLVNFSSKVNNSNVELIGSSSFISCSVKFVRTLI